MIHVSASDGSDLSSAFDSDSSNAEGYDWIVPDDNVDEEDDGAVPEYTVRLTIVLLLD